MEFAPIKFVVPRFFVEGLSLFAGFWIIIIGAQYYILYRKYESISVCQAQQARLDAEVEHLGEGGAQTVGGPAAQGVAGLGGGGDLKAQILQMAAQNPGSVIDLRSSQPSGDQP